MSLTANWSYPTAIRFGAGRIAEIGEACAGRHHAPLLVTDRGLATMEITARTLDLMEAGAGPRDLRRGRPEPDRDRTSRPG
jgi:alcohol dehydrogenase class IV